MLGSVGLLFMIAFLLMSIYQFWQATLDDAVRNAARQIEIGKVTTSSGLVSAICAEFGAVAPCSSSSLQVEVQSASTFGAITPATVSSSGVLSPANAAGTTYTLTVPTTGGLPVLVQVAYIPPFVPHFPFLPNVVFTGNSTSALISAVSFMVY